MANTNALPSLTEAGFITNKNLILTKLFGYFLASEYSQSNVFIGKINSLKYILGMNLAPAMFTTAVETSLNKLYAPYFDSVKVITERNDTGGGIVNVYINVICTDGDKTYDLSKEVKIKDGNMVEFENNLDALYDYYKGE